ncbi:MAG: VanZ family protein [Oscillospiraceae bacterium]|nr:VanZ family protein [Oscillospiraceae bacterium]
MGKINSRRNNLLLIALFSVLTLLWMLLIYWFSANNGDDSGAMSGRILKKLLSLFYPHWSDKTAYQQNRIIDKFHLLFRKLGHFSEYLVLGIFLRITWALVSSVLIKSRQKHPAGDILLPAFLSFLYACSDEYHQRFVQGRSGEFRDVMIDFTGACVGILAVSVILYLMHRKHRQKPKKKQYQMLH